MSRTPRSPRCCSSSSVARNGELAAAMRYFTQGWNEPDEQRRSMMLDIATEELSHLEMVAQTLHMLLKGSPSELVDQVEGNYLGEMLNGKMPDYASMSLNSGPNILGGGGPRLTDSMGAPWTAAYIDTIGQPAADLRSDIAAEARAKITYERLIKFTDDVGVKDTLTFLMTREVAHQKMFEAALASIEENFPPGNTCRRRQGRTCLCRRLRQLRRRRQELRTRHHRVRPGPGQQRLGLRTRHRTRRARRETGGAITRGPAPAAASSRSVRKSC